MKCIKNAKSGQIIRVSDTQANNTVGREWSFVSKSEWKAATRKPVAVEETQEETIAQKQLKRKKKQ
jgi:hypothetical protein